MGSVFNQSTIGKVLLGIFSPSKDETEAIKNNHKSVSANNKQKSKQKKKNNKVKKPNSTEVVNVSHEPEMDSAEEAEVDEIVESSPPVVSTKKPVESHTQLDDPITAIVRAVTEKASIYGTVWTSSQIEASIDEMYQKNLKYDNVDGILDYLRENKVPQEQRTLISSLLPSPIKTDLGNPVISAGKPGTTPVAPSLTNLLGSMTITPSPKASLSIASHQGTIHVPAPHQDSGLSESAVQILHWLQGNAPVLFGNAIAAPPAERVAVLAQSMRRSAVPDAISALSVYFVSHFGNFPVFRENIWVFLQGKDVLEAILLNILGFLVSNYHSDGLSAAIAKETWWNRMIELLRLCLVANRLRDNSYQTAVAKLIDNMANALVISACWLQQQDCDGEYEVVPEWRECMVSVCGLIAGVVRTAHTELWRNDEVIMACEEAAQGVKSLLSVPPKFSPVAGLDLKTLFIERENRYDQLCSRLRTLECLRDIVQFHKRSQHVEETLLTRDKSKLSYSLFDNALRKVNSTLLEQSRAARSSQREKVLTFGVNDAIRVRIPSHVTRDKELVALKDLDACIASLKKGELELERQLQSIRTALAEVQAKKASISSRSPSNASPKAVATVDSEELLESIRVLRAQCLATLTPSALSQDEAWLNVFNVIKDRGFLASCPWTDAGIEHILMKFIDNNRVNMISVALTAYFEVESECVHALCSRMNSAYPLIHEVNQKYAQFSKMGMKVVMNELVQEMSAHINGVNEDIVVINIIQECLVNALLRTGNLFQTSIATVFPKSSTVKIVRELHATSKNQPVNAPDMLVLILHNGLKEAFNAIGEKLDVPAAGAPVSTKPPQITIKTDDSVKKSVSFNVGESNKSTAMSTPSKPAIKSKKSADILDVIAEEVKESTSTSVPKKIEVAVKEPEKSKEVRVKTESVTAKPKPNPAPKAELKSLVPAVSVVKVDKSSGGDIVRAVQSAPTLKTTIATSPVAVSSIATPVIGQKMVSVVFEPLPKRASRTVTANKSGSSTSSNHTALHSNSAALREHKVAKPVAPVDSEKKWSSFTKNIVVVAPESEIESGVGSSADSSAAVE